MMWFDRKKAFDSVPHDWIIQALQLSKIPVKIINVIKNLMHLWSTKVHLLKNQHNLESDKISYHTGVIQGDCLSLILFILSFFLSTLNGYQIGKPDSKRTNISHLFFVDDLKTYAQNIREVKQQLDLIATFSKDIKLEFGIDKCSYINIERGMKSLGVNLCLNDLEISELENGECYKYLGQNEDIVFDNVLNKERVMAEYLKRVKKI